MGHDAAVGLKLFDLLCGELCNLIVQCILILNNIPAAGCDTILYIKNKSIFLITQAVGIGCLGKIDP